MPTHWIVSEFRILSVSLVFALSRGVLSGRERGGGGWFALGHPDVLQHLLDAFERKLRPEKREFLSVTT